MGVWGGRGGGGKRASRGPSAAISFSTACRGYGGSGRSGFKAEGSGFGGGRGGRGQRASPEPSAAISFSTACRGSGGSGFRGVGSGFGGGRRGRGQRASPGPSAAISLSTACSKGDQGAWGLEGAVGGSAPDGARDYPFLRAWSHQRVAQSHPKKTKHTDQPQAPCLKPRKKKKHKRNPKRRKITRQRERRIGC